MNTICEGIDNIESINKHYEKIKIDFFKNKLITQMLMSSQSNSQRQLSSNNIMNYYQNESEYPDKPPYPNINNNSKNNNIKVNSNNGNNTMKGSNAAKLNNLLQVNLQKLPT